ncbi:MAG TPA: hypothetical protein VFT58_03320, partial [Nitrososphaera sp.]|nr:hypothetical protein [Nitrososphaera sp.]
RRDSGEWKTSEQAEESSRPRLVDSRGTVLDSYTDRIQRVRHHLSMLATCPPEYDPLQNDAAAQVLLELSGAHAIPSAVVEAAAPRRLANAA